MKTIKNFDLKGKKVIIRCDLNVPMKGGKIADDNRILESLETLKYATEQGAKVIVLSHLGRVKTEEDKKKYTLRPIADRLNKLIDSKVTFVEDTKGEEVETAIKQMKTKEIIMLENTRFEDLDGNKESENDKELAKYWASLGDIFINDAFGTAHRSHASNVGIAEYLPSGIGMLMDREIKQLSKATTAPKKPYVVILGGAKVSDKIDVIKFLCKKADYVLIGGAMAMTFLKAAGFEVGKSSIENKKIDFCIEMLDKYSNKIVLPIDIVTGTEINKNAETHSRFINEIGEDEIGLDIGPRTVKVFKQYLDDAKTIVWNGPLGYFELEPFAEGTRQIFDIISKTKATTIIGGGETANAAINMGYQSKLSHISTGGGASLAMLEGKELPALKVLNAKK